MSQTVKGWVDIISGLSVIATMFFIGLQWHEMKKSGSDTHDLAIQAKAQADFAKKQADAAKAESDNTRSLAESAKAQSAATSKLAAAAKHSAEAAQKSLAVAETANRAWIGIVFKIPPFGENKGSQITYLALNTGRGAVLTTFSGAAETPYAEFPTHPNYPPNYGSTKPSHALLVPNMVETGHFPSQILTPAQIQAVKDGTVTLYVYAEVDYVDIQSNTTHVTHACSFYVPSTNEFQACYGYNDAN